MQKYSEIVATTKADGTVEVLPGATVTVYLTGTTTLASLYSDNGITAKANPFQSAALTGRIEFYAADGRYDIKIDKAGYTTVTVADILIEDPEDIGVLEDVTLVDATISTSTVTNSTLSQCILVNTEIQDVDSLQLTGTPPAVLQPRMLSWNNDEGTADLSLLDGTVLQMGQELHYRARNTTASTIADGAVVWATGTSGATGRINIGLAVADGSQPGKTVMGLMTHATAAGSDGYVANFGKVRGINTTGSAVGETWVNGDILYLHPTIPGALTKVKPAVNGNIVVTVAIVIYAGNNGTLFVRPTADSQEADEIRYTPAGTGAVATTVQSKLRETVSVKDFGAVGDGVTDDTLAIQTAINALGALGQGRLIGTPGASYKITDTIDFTVLGHTHNWYEIDFAGADFTWYGSQVGADPMFYFYGNKAVKVQNFTLIANPAVAISATVKGIFVDSLQPDGADLLVFSDFKIRLANIAVDLGSPGVSQNRVSDSRFEHFLLEACSVGFQTNSTNCDSLIFTNGQLSGCGFGFNFVRAGFSKIDTCIGYDCDPFIRIAGPIGPLTVISCQSEPETLPIGTFLYRNRYDNARDGVITLVGCNVNEKIWLDYDPMIGSDIQTLNLVGGYFTDLAIDAPDSRVNLIGSNQYSTGVLTIAGTNSRCFNEGSFIGGSIVDTAGGYRLVSPVDGVFTPTIVGTSSAGTATYSAQVGSYTRVNDICFFQIYIVWSGGTGTGNLRVGGLPFQSKNNSVFGFGTMTVGYSSGITLAANSYLTAYTPSESTEIALTNNTLGGGAASFVSYSGSGEILLSGQYKV